MPYSYNGWQASRDPRVIGVNTTWEPLPGIRFPGGTKAGDVETVMTYLVRQLDARVERAAEYRPGDDWGWAYRANVNNPSTLSCHASATAIDYNATQHPNRRKYTWTRAQAREIHRIIDDELAGVIRWLEGFDEMHFEIRGTPLQVAKVAKKIRDGATTPPEPPVPAVPEEDDVPWILQATGKPTRLMAAPTLAIPVSDATRDAAKVSGAKVFPVTPDEYDAIIAQYKTAND